FPAFLSVVPPRRMGPFAHCGLWCAPHAPNRDDRGHLRSRSEGLARPLRRAFRRPAPGPRRPLRLGLLERPGSVHPPADAGVALLPRPPLRVLSRAPGVVGTADPGLPRHLPAVAQLLHQRLRTAAPRRPAAWTVGLGLQPHPLATAHLPGRRDPPAQGRRARLLVGLREPTRRR